MDKFRKFDRDRQKIAFLGWLVGISSLILFCFSTLRFTWFRAGTDLVFFDQLVFLLSQGQAPISSILEGVHLIGDHGAIIFYPLSLLYVIYPSVLWLLAIQAIAFAVGSVPIYALSRDSGLGISYSRAIALCYVLYPAIFNINFYTEFRPEAIAIPAVLWAILAAKKRSPGQFAIAILLVLSCKETMSLTVFALGVWLALFQKRWLYGLGCIMSGLGWFIWAAVYLIPTFRAGRQMAGTWHYESLGSSMSEIGWTILSQPQILLSRSIQGDRLFYYLLLILPILLGLHWRKLTAIVPALPMLLLNILADYPRQRDLIHHYSLPIIPFLFVWLIASLVYIKKRRLRSWLSPRWLIIWAVLAFLALGKYGYFWTRYAVVIPNLDAVRGAVNLVEPSDRVLTTAFIASALGHRPTIKLIQGEWDLKRIETNSLDTILIGLQHLGWDTSVENANQTIDILNNSSKFDLVYHQQNVFLYKKASSQKLP